MRRRFIKNQVKVNPDKCLSIEAIEDNVEISTDISLIEYSINGGAWSKLEKGYVINLMEGHVALFKRSAGYLGARLGSFYIANKCKLSGNCMALLYGENSDKNFDLSACVNVFNRLFENCSSIISVSRDFLPATTLADYCYDGMFLGCTSLVNAPELPATTLTDYCYSDMFQNCTSLTSAPELPATTLASNCYSYMFSKCTSLVNAPKLPATTLTDGCYRGMFYRCTSLTSAPKLPATTLADSCYCGMFWDCTSLVNAPQLPATTLKSACYYNMFSRCTSLVNAPELPATTLANNCYFDMFFGCTKLTNAPELPATTLTDGCYLYMFSGCTSLVNAPELPATTLTDYCYNSMFYGCTNLNYIKALFTTIPSTSSTTNWVSGVASTGIFVKNKDATWNTTPGALSYDGVPAGWTVVNDGEESGGMIATLLVNQDNGQIGIDVYNYMINNSIVSEYIGGEGLVYDWHPKDNDNIMLSGTFDGITLNNVRVTSANKYPNTDFELNYEGKGSFHFVDLNETGYLTCYDDD